MPCGRGVLVEPPASTHLIAWNTAALPRRQYQRAYRPFDGRQRADLRTATDIPRQRDMGPVGARFRSETAGPELILQIREKALQRRRRGRGSAPEHPRSGKPADPIDPQREGIPPQGTGGRLRADKTLGVELPKKDERQMEIQGVRPPCPRRDQRIKLARQRFARARLGPDREEPAFSQGLRQAPAAVRARPAPPDGGPRRARRRTESAGSRARCREGPRRTRPSPPAFRGCRPPGRRCR